MSDLLEAVVAVRVVPPHVLDVMFSDGMRREVDLEHLLWSEVFGPLCDPAYFAQVTVDRELGTVVWPNDADLAPEFLYYGEAGPPPGYYEAELPSTDPLRVSTGVE